ncbi:P-type conjugative transfer protein VirB9 [Rickettsia endosymbiont of Halotydeus destructor]|uniref:P-type conjugative transfer protein VirB9 n=1 Tax=Rickettsia endosymbiont of Halotydeus destructor TaxID=2996754 RepID=UPI003BAED1C3
MKQLLLFCILIFGALNVFAIIASRPLGTDPRIRSIVYNPNDVFEFIGYYGYQASIELARDEEIVSISMGDTTSWQIVTAGHRIFIKPMEQDATTNMTLITNKRTYFFELYAKETLDIRDPNLTFNVRFIYPDDETDSSGHMQTYATSSASPDLGHPEKYNFNYYISGNEEIAPIKIFDDGEFTYLQFRDKNAKIPSVFAVDDALRESMVNYRLDQTTPNRIILEGVFPKLSIRESKKVTCVFNESFKAY